MNIHQIVEAINALIDQVEDIHSPEYNKLLNLLAQARDEATILAKD